MMRKLGGLSLVLLLSAACSTATDSAGIAPPTDASNTTRPPTVTSTTSPTIIPVAVDPCDLVAAAEVKAATGLAVLEVRDEPPINCVFELDADPGIRMVVTIEDGAGRFAGPANLFAEYTLLIEEGEAEAIAGVGEGAVCCPFRAIAVDAGAGRYIAVSVGGGYHELAEPLDALRSVAEAVLARL